MGATPEIKPPSTGPSKYGEDDIKPLLKALLKTFESDALEKLTPRLPSFYDPTDWPKRKAEDVWTESQQIWSDFSSLRARMDDDLAFIAGKQAGIFEDAEADEKEMPFHDVSARAEYQLLLSQIASIEPSYQPEAMRLTDRDEAALKADFLYACDSDDKRRANQSGNPSYRFDVVKSAMSYGRVAAQLIIDFNTDICEQPFRTRLLNPSTTCPIFEEDRGMAKMVLQYRTNLGSALSGLKVSGRLRDEIRNGKRGGSIASSRRTDREECRVTEYWDRRWKYVFINGDCVQGPQEHNLSSPPFVYQMGSLGLPGFVTELVTESQAVRGEPGYFTVTSSSSEAAMASKGVSHVHLLRYPHFLREAIGSRTLTQFRKEANPAYVVKQSWQAAKEGVPFVDDGPGGRTPLALGEEELEELRTSMKMETYAPLMEIVNQGLQKSTIPLNFFGVAEQSQQSGFANENLAELGRDKLAPHIVTIENFYQQVAEMKLKLFMNYGALLKQGPDGKRGEFEVPRSSKRPLEKDQQPYSILVPEDVRRTGYRVEVRMSSVRLSTLGALGNAIQIWRNGQNGPLMTKREALELRAVSNVDGILTELDAEVAMSDPVVKDQEMIAYFAKQGAWDIVESIAKRQAMLAMGAAPGGAPGPPGVPGAPPGGSPDGGMNPVAIQGASNAQFGAGGGAPMGPRPTTNLVPQG
jgi:hypothetical protein